MHKLYLTIIAALLAVIFIKTNDYAKKIEEETTRFTNQIRGLEDERISLTRENLNFREVINAQRTGLEKAQHTIDQLEKEHEIKDQLLKERQKVQIKEVEKIVDRVIYKRECIDDDGFNTINEDIEV